MKRILLIVVVVSVLVLSCTHIEVSTPEGFAPYEGTRQYMAVSPEGMRFRIKIVENDPQQDIAFWTEAMSTHLAKEGYRSAGQSEEFSASGKAGISFEWAVPYGSEDYLYMTAIVVDGDMIAVAEAAAEQTVYTAYRDALNESLQSIDLSKVNVRAATKPEREPRVRRPRRRFSFGAEAESAAMEPDDYSGGGAADERRMLSVEQEAPAPTAKSAAGADSPTTNVDSDPVETERKRVYSGACRIRVDDVIEAKNDISSLAEEIGGYVERISGNTIVIRVPAESFESSFRAVMALGEVLDKRRDTVDVTTYFRDQTVRLNLAEKARNRLYDLLDRTEDVQERLKILREIGRLTEEIEDIRSSLDVLKRMIAFSRISVYLEPKLQATYRDRRSIPFNWIAQLDPLYPSVWGKPKNVSIQLEDDYAVFEDQDSYRAESAEGTRVRLGNTANDPRGGNAFWQRALSYHLEDYYRSAREFAAGAFKGVIFTSKDSDPYTYLVAVIDAEGEKELTVFEAFFPDDTAFNRRIEGIRAALTEVEVK